MKTIALTAAVMMGLGTVSASSEAADPHIDDLAFTLRNQAAQACREARLHFRHSPQFDHLYADLYEMYTLADHMHDVATDGYAPTDHDHIRSDAEQLDELFHHVEEMVADMSTRDVHHYHGHYGYGRRHDAFHLRRLNGILAGMEDTLHHLLEDVAPVQGGEVPVPPAGPALPPSVEGTTYYESTPVGVPVYTSRSGRLSIVVGGGR